MKARWHTAWQGPDLVIFQNDVETDRFASEQVQRIIFAYHGAGLTPGDTAFAVVELPHEHLILRSETGFAGRVHFERQRFWSKRKCIYWVPESEAPLPPKLRRGLWFLPSSAPVVSRLPSSEIASFLENWPLVGPQTWEERKWQRIAMSRPFASSACAADLS